MLEMHNQRKPLSEMGTNGTNGRTDFMFRVPNSPAFKAKNAVENQETQRVTHDVKKMLITLREQLGAVLKSKPSEEPISSAGI